MRKITPSDITLIKKYVEIRDDNPCRTCGYDVSTCCGCSAQRAWLDKFKAAETLTGDIPEEVKVLLQQYLHLTQQICELRLQKQNLETELTRTCQQLADYVDSDVLDNSECTSATH